MRASSWTGSRPRSGSPMVDASEASLRCCARGVRLIVTTSAKEGQQALLTSSIYWFADEQKKTAELSSITLM